MSSYITDIDKEPWVKDPRFPDVALQLLVSQSHTSTASMVRVHVQAGGNIATHAHQTETEIIYIVRGEAELVLNGVKHLLYTGACAVILPSTVHSLHNSGHDTVEILAIHSPPTR
jgi:quercetin dioxygenase-like cupin family protein